MKSLILPFFFLLTLPLSGTARTVLYTTHDRPPESRDDTVEVVYLDAADTLQDEWFHQQGIELSEENAPQIIALLQSSKWQAQESRLTQAYQGIIQAWQLGVARVPAVVVDDQWVVYGLTDIHRAQKEIHQFQQVNGGVR